MPWACHQSLLLKIIDIASKSSMTIPTFWEVSTKLHHASITLGRKLRLREKKTQEKFDSTIKSKVGIWPAPILLAHSAELSATWLSYIDSGNTSTRTTQPNGMRINQEMFDRDILICLFEGYIKRQPEAPQFFFIEDLHILWWSIASNRATSQS